MSGILAHPPAGVLEAFGLAGASCALVTDNEKKPVWRVSHGNQTWYLKRMPHAEGRLRFMLAAVQHLAAAGVNTPVPVQARTGEPFARDETGLHLLFPAVNGREVEYDQRGEHVAAALARFHRASYGFRAPADADPQTNLGEWPRQYDKNIAALDRFAAQAAARPHGGFERAFLEALPELRDRAVACRAALEQGAYRAWCERAAAAGLLSHQDFAASNLLQDDAGRLWVLDLDSVLHDVPGRDIRKLVNKLLKKRDPADAELVRAVLQAYRSEHPLSDEEVRVTLIDLAFPHLFFGIASKYFESRTEDWSEAKKIARLHETIEIERPRLKLVETVLGHPVTG